ncbi:MAG: hypothetical protein HQL38_18135 [Alphaproteobacteria bacterium]|nr:hypothetical protein [Alphaproteobacteria bacterium]
MPEAVAARLAEEGMLCLYRGRSECGPRALGHRSILARPDLPHGRDRLNAIEGRDWYRPLAPIILDHAAVLALHDHQRCAGADAWRRRATSIILRAAPDPRPRGRALASCHDRGIRGA